jgi:hypothetical protein
MLELLAQAHVGRIAEQTEPRVRGIANDSQQDPIAQAQISSEPGRSLFSLVPTD